MCYIQLTMFYTVRDPVYILLIYIMLYINIYYIPLVIKLRIPPQAQQHRNSNTHRNKNTRLMWYTTEKSQAPDDGCINVRNMSSIEEVK